MLRSESGSSRGNLIIDGGNSAMKMTTEEAFVKVLQMHGIEHAFGIIGSAMMPISDLFPKAGISFWDCGHECNAGMMADGFTRASGKMSMMVAQNGPGITNFVTPVKTAYWNHTPLLLVTPQAANMTMGQGGFQEVPQMSLFEDMVAYQEEVLHPSRMAEVLNRVIMQSKRASAPAQINVPRDFWTQVVDIELPSIVDFELPAGGEEAIGRAASLLSNAKFPVILNGGGVVIGGAIEDTVTLAERLDAPVCCGYQHNDAFPGSHPLFAGPLGYNGSKAGMQLISKADVVLALGTRLNPFSTLPGYGIDYWPDKADIIQVDINPDRIGLTKTVSVGIVGDSKKVANAIFEKLSSKAGDSNREERKKAIEMIKADWDQELNKMDHEEDDPGTTWNERARAREPEKITARMAWRAIKKALPKEAIISSDIGNNCAIGNAYPTFEQGRKYLAPGMFGPCGYGFPAICGAKIAQPNVPVVGFAGDGAFGISMNEMAACGRDEWPAITMIIFRNYQWGAEKRNTTLWFDDNFVGTELNLDVSYADVAKACGVEGFQAVSMDDLNEKLTLAIKAQMEEGKTTFIEVMTNQELGEPFRRDAMKKPVPVAGIDKADMRPQKG
jgi:sulfoacetaldehyde acetyltransferase